MNKNIIKIVAGFALMLSLVTPAVAVAPLALAAAEMLLTPIIFGGASLLLTPSATINVPKTGTATPTGIQRNMLAKIGPTAAIAVAGYIAYNDIRAIVERNPQDYPVLASHLSSYDREYWKEAEALSSPYSGKGRIVYAPAPTNKYYLLGNYLNNTMGASSSAPSIIVSNGNVGIKYKTQNGLNYYATYLATNVPEPPLQLKVTPDAELPSKINSPSLNELYPTVLTDVDKLIKANTDKVQLPMTLSSDINAAKKQLSLDTIAASNAKTVQFLNDIRDEKKAAYDANPTPENKEALDKAEADLASAEAKQAQDDLTATKYKEDEEKSLAEEDSVLTPPEPPELLEINYQPLVDMGNDLGSKFPFSLLATLKDFATSLIATPQTPVFEITFPSPFNYTWTFDLSIFDGIAQFVRVLIGMSFLAYCTMFLIRRWH